MDMNAWRIYPPRMIGTELSEVNHTGDRDARDLTGSGTRTQFIAVVPAKQLPPADLHRTRLPLPPDQGTPGKNSRSRAVARLGACRLRPTEASPLTDQMPARTKRARVIATSSGARSEVSITRRPSERYSRTSRIASLTSSGRAWLARRRRRT